MEDISVSNPASTSEFVFPKFGWSALLESKSA
jgi:hypothetical protein